MIHEVILPKLGTNMDEGVIQEWRKREGERVSRGEVLALVETSKAVFEVESEYDGFLRKIYCRKDEQAAFTTPVAIITDAPDEDISGRIQRTPEPGKRYHEKKRAELVSGGHAPRAGKISATPAARRLAGELKVDIRLVAGAFDCAVIDESLVREFSGLRKTAIYGAGLGVKQAKELLRSCKEAFVVGVYDDNEALKGKEAGGFMVAGAWADFKKAVEAGEVDSVVVSLHSEFRRTLIERIKNDPLQVHLMPLVDSRAIVSCGVELSPGVFVEAGAVIGPDTFLGEGVIVDAGAIVSHDCYIGAHSHLSPGCVLSGVVELEENVLVGVGAAINSQVTVGRNSVVTPCTAVVTDVPPDSVISGNPGKVIGRSLRGRA